MKRTIKYISGMLLLTIAIPSFATMSAPRGWYLDGHVGSSSESGKHYPGSASQSGIGGSADVGYKFTRYFGAEVNYATYASSNIQDNTSNTQAAFDRHYSYNFALKGILPIRQTAWELFAKAGVGQAKSSVGIVNQTGASNLNISGSSHTSTGLFLAGGAQYFFSPQMALNTEWARQQGNSSTGNLSLLSLGLTLIFA